MKVKKIIFCLLGIMAVILPVGQEPNYEYEADKIASSRHAGYFCQSYEYITLARRTEKNYGYHIRLYSKRFKVNPDLLVGIIAVECSGEKNKNPMQTTEVAARHVGMEKQNHATGNIKAGTVYLKYLLTEFKDTKTAVAAFNLGPTRIKEWQERPGGFDPMKVAYVKKVLAIKKIAEQYN